MDYISEENSFSVIEIPPSSDRDSFTPQEAIELPPIRTERRQPAGAGDGTETGSTATSSVCDFLRRIWRRIKRRLRRGARYPLPADQLFHRSELLMFVAPVGSILKVATAYHVNGILSEQGMDVLIILLVSGVASVRLGKTLQNILPELAVFFMLAGDGLLFAPYVDVLVNALPDGKYCWKHWMVYLPLFLVASNYSAVLFKCFREDVREPDDIIPH